MSDENPKRPDDRILGEALREVANDLGDEFDKQLEKEEAEEKAFGPVVEGYEDAADDLGGGWSYRVIKFPTHYALHEVFYNKAGEPTAHTENPITFVCDLDEGKEVMIKSLVWALKDVVDKPVLTPEDFPYSKKDEL